MEMSLDRYRMLSDPIFSKKFEVRYEGDSYWITPMTLELRVNTITHSLCLVKKPFKDTNSFYNSDVNYFKHAGGIIGENIRFRFDKTDLGEQVILVKATHLVTDKELYDIDQEFIVGFDQLELKMINARYLSKVKELSSIGKDINDKSRYK